MHGTHFRGSIGGLLHMYQGYTFSFTILIAHFVLVIYKGIGRPSASKRKVRVFLDCQNVWVLQPRRLILFCNHCEDENISNSQCSIHADFEISAIRLI